MKKPLKNRNHVFKYLTVYEPIIVGLVELFNPYLEVAVHDLETGKIAKLYNGFSKRKIGDPTPIHELEIRTDQFPDAFPPYFKENWDGRPLKCTSTTIRNENKKPVGLICFNFDVSVIQNLTSHLQNFLQIPNHSENPVELFSENWKTTVSQAINNFLRDENLSIENLSLENKKALVQSLYSKGVFNFKNAPTYIAQKLKVSRASIYNYLSN